MGTLLSTIASNIIKYLGINMTIKFQNIYNENFKSMEKRIEKDTRKWTHILCS